MVLLALGGNPPGSSAGHLGGREDAKGEEQENSTQAGTLSSARGVPTRNGPMTSREPWKRGRGSSRPVPPPPYAPNTEMDQRDFDLWNSVPRRPQALRVQMSCLVHLLVF